MKTDHVTINDVSSKAGVSKSTVSRYLNGKFEHMSTKTKAKVKKAIEELKYRPNLTARTLKSQKTNLIGVIVSDITNPVTVHLIKGVIDECAKEGYQVVTACSDEDTEKEKEYAQAMIDRQVEGLIIGIVDYNEFSHLENLKEMGAKIVLADRTISRPMLDMVTTDNYEMTKDAIRNLYSTGFERVALFSPDLLKSKVRFERYTAFLNQSKEYVDDPNELVYLLKDTKDYLSALRDFKMANPSKRLAAFASTPISLLNFLGAVNELELGIPEEIGICGYDNLPWTKLISGGITVVEQPFYEVGKKSAELLIKRINGLEDNGPQYVVLKSRLIIRNSTMGGKDGQIQD